MTRSSLPPFEEYCREIRGLWDSHWLTNMREKHDTLEQTLRDYLGCDFLPLYADLDLGDVDRICDLILG